MKADEIRKMCNERCKCITAEKGEAVYEPSLVRALFEISAQLAEANESSVATAQQSSMSPIQVFNDRELATVLHSLRILQETRTNQFLGGCWDRERHGFNGPESCDHFEEVSPLTNGEIDALCERINLAPEKPVHHLSGAVRDFVRLAAAGNTGVDDLQRLACDLLGMKHPKRMTNE